ncbi:putative ABC transporter permease YknZ [Poriferisphaera corsica]|uniref:Putative ABC transporter permease YknZ n=2 Tax=Poriferisphaera corsica TaxID=2528020 RepID=A0A517YQV3_9BACT|nr:putative ABC transporter permease YknZ [Poriferisphaera corsica]
MLHKLRSLLTALGIIIGIAAVVSMASYGEGAKQAALEDIRQLGARNIIVRSVKPPDSNQASDSRQFAPKYGLLRRDLRRIEQTVGPIERIVPLKKVGAQAQRGRYKTPAAVFGTTPVLMDVASLKVARGRYLTEADMLQLNKVAVAVIGAEIADRLFPLVDPIGSQLRVDTQTFEVVGVLNRIGLAGGAGSALVGRDLNFDVHIAMPVAKARFGDTLFQRSSGSMQASQVEISELYIQAPEEDQVVSVSEQVKRVLEKEHKQQQDTSLTVPLELLIQKEKTQQMFNIMMILIAGLSLLVGGIGIMNIMLASVTERTREIGIRRALGATRHHIVMQFLVETTVLSGIGGVIGVGVGLGGVGALTVLHQLWPDLEQPQVTMWSIAVSFVVATSVGVVFGLYPAIKASQQDPIVALRHD